MKQTKSKKRILFTFFNLFFLSILCIKGVGAVPVGNQTVTYGSSIQLVHVKTGKALATGDEKYSHAGSSQQYAVYGSSAAADSNSQQWIVKGPHADNDRWNAQFGRPVRKGAVLRLENVAQGRNLHSNDLPSPKSSGQNEVTAFGANGLGDGKGNDDLTVLEFKDQSTDGVLCDGSVVQLLHKNTSRRLRSNDIEWVAGKQEVAAFSGADDYDWFRVQLIQTPAEQDKVKGEWEKQRGSIGTLNYNMLLWIDPLNTGNSLDREFNDVPQETINSPGSNNSRLWTHGGSRHSNEGSPEPYRHVELLGGPWSDGRTQRGSSWFFLQNADDASKQGPVNYGDRVKIRSVFAGAGYGTMSGMLNPAKIWWVNDASRHGGSYREIVISHPDHPNTKNDQSVFMFEAIFPRLTSGPIYQTDAVQIRNAAFNKGVLWLNSDSRWGNTYDEILVNNDDDAWGKNSGYQNSRENIFHRFYLRHVVRDWVPDDGTRQTFDTIISNFNLKRIEVEQLKLALAADQKAALNAQKAVYDAKAAEDQRKLDEATAVALELQRLANFPLGFVEVPGKAKDVAIDFVEIGKGKAEKTVFKHGLLMLMVISCVGKRVQINGMPIH